MKLLFDCDGTILDSMHIWTEPIRRLLKEYEYKLTKEKKGEIESMDFDGTIKWLHENVCKDKSEKEIYDYFADTIKNAYENELMPKKGGKEILRKLKDAGYDMCITSSTNKDFLISALKRLDLLDLFDFLHTPDGVGYRKDEKKYWQLVLDRYEIKASDALLFDDALYAIKTAKKLGIKTAGIKDFPYNEGEWEDIKKKADLVLESIADIKQKTIENL